jgi:glutamate racemase
MRPDAHVVITDSGLGGLSVCAALERGLRLAAEPRRVRLTYVNAWPYEDRGYNDLPDDEARARVFDSALARMAQMQPDRILIACNTLSILYPQTAFSRNPAVPVRGIVDAGVDLVAGHLAERADASVVLLGTKTTIASGEHAARLVQRGTDPRRIAAVDCHGLAGAIERDVDGPRTAELIRECGARAAAAAPPGGLLFLGLCCTHYAYVASRLVAAASVRTPRPVGALNPNERLTSALLHDPGFLAASGRANAGEGTRRAPIAAAVSVELVSKVTLPDIARERIARLVEPISPATATALLSYALVPDLF